MKCQKTSSAGHYFSCGPSRILTITNVTTSQFLNAAGAIKLSTCHLDLMETGSVKSSQETLAHFQPCAVFLHFIRCVSHYTRVNANISPAILYIQLRIYFWLKFLYADIKLLSYRLKYRSRFGIWIFNFLVVVIIIASVGWMKSPRNNISIILGVFEIWMRFPYNPQPS
jgi:hypothetical protein